MPIYTKSVAEFEAWVRDFISKLVPHKKSATIIALSGELGAGKTNFVQVVARTLGVEENITSPTFVLQKNYRLEEQAWKELVHIDAYRLKSSHELEVLGWKELIADPSHLICIEWPEKVADIVPGNAVRIKIEYGEGEERVIWYAR